MMNGTLQTVSLNSSLSETACSAKESMAILIDYVPQAMTNELQHQAMKMASTQRKRWHSESEQKAGGAGRQKGHLVSFIRQKPPKGDVKERSFMSFC